jgi:hypothetical protein
MSRFNLFNRLKLSRGISSWFLKNFNLHRRDISVCISPMLPAMALPALETPPSPTQVALFDAARRGDIGGIRAALADGANPLMKEAKEEYIGGDPYPYEIALNNKHLGAAAYLLDCTEPAARDFPNIRLRVVARDFPEAMEMLVDYGADINSALFHAVVFNRLDLARALLERGADKLSVLFKGWIPENPKIYRLLLRGESDKNLDLGWILFHFAIYPNSEMINTLLYECNIRANQLDNLSLRLILERDGCAGLAERLALAIHGQTLAEYQDLNREPFV